MSVGGPRVKLNSGYYIPAFGLGTWKAPQGEVAQAVRTAVEVGYRHIDCAHVYENEEEIGVALNYVIGKVVKREDLFVTSKLWCTSHRAELVERACRETLRALHLDYLDLYLIHWPQGYKEGDELFPKDSFGKMQFSDVDIVETWQAMEALVDKGLVRSIGISNFNRRQIERLLTVAKITPAVNQVEVHPYLTQEKLIDFCRSKTIDIIAYSPLGSPDRPWAEPTDPSSLIDDPKVNSVADKYGKRPAQLLIRFALDRGLIVIAKSSNATRIKQNYQVFDFQLTEEDITLLASLNRNRRCFTMEDDKVHPLYPFHEEY